MNAFIFSLMALTIITFLRYWLVRIQSSRAIKLASKKSIEHIRKCEKAFLVARQKLGNDASAVEVFSTHIKKALNNHGVYFDEYHKDFDYNKLWLDPTKWTLGQMYPSLVNTKVIDIQIGDTII